MARKKKGIPAKDDDPPLPAAIDDQFSEEVVAGKTEFEDHPAEDEIERILRNIEEARQQVSWPRAAQPYDTSPVKEEDDDEIAALKSIWNKNKATTSTSTSAAAPTKPKPNKPPAAEGNGGISSVRLEHFMTTPPAPPETKKKKKKKQEQEEEEVGIGRLLLYKPGSGYKAPKFTIGDVMLLG